MTRGIFVTAIGTDVGKTYVSALLVKKMRDLGYNCGYFKPALSGAEEINGEIIPGDCAYVLKTAGINKKPQDVASYIFKTAVSPHLAAEIEGVTIQKNKIKKDFEDLKKEFDYIIVEGAGGIICPFNLDKKNQLLLSDVIKSLDLDVIVVATTKLGSINATVLTTEYIKSQGINVRGIILNNYTPDDFMEVDNKNQIEYLSGINIITEVCKNEKDLNITEEKLLSIFKEI